MAKRFETKNGNSSSSKGAKRIKALRKKNNWSQRELAEEFYVSPAAVAHWESGEREVQGPALKLLEIYEGSSKGSKLR